MIKAQIPLHGPDQTSSETRVYDQVSDKVRLGPLGFSTSLRTLSGRRHVSRSRFAGYDARRARPTGGRLVTSTARYSRSVSLSVVVGESTARVDLSHVKVT